MRTPEQVQENPNMEDRNVFMQAIENFESRQSPLSEELERFISYIAKTGDILGPWEKVQRVFMKKLELALDDFYSTTPYKAGKVNANATNDDFEEMKKRLLQLVEEFDSPPFTIQRLCELLSDPRKNYTKCDKFMRGIEKNLMVVSSWNYLPRSYESNDRMNGNMGTSNGYMPPTDRFKPHWANLPPSPVSTTPPKIPGAPDFTEVSAPPPVSASEPTQPKQEDVKADQSEGTEPKQEAKSENVETEGDMEVKEPAKREIPPSVEDSPSTKRKLEEEEVDKESSNQEETEESKEIEEESPTKRIKQDEEESTEKEEKQTENTEKQENSATEESDAKPADSASSEGVNDDSTESEGATGDSAKSDQDTDSAKSTECKSDDSAKDKSAESAENSTSDLTESSQDRTDTQTGEAPTEEKNDESLQMEVD